MPRTKHIHKYFKINGANHKLFRCAITDCTFFIHPGLFETLIGKMSHCNSCDNKFVMSELSITEDKPICDDCRLRSVLGLKRTEDNEIGIQDLDDFLSIKGID